MGNGCSVFKINKVCIDGDLNIVAEKEDSQNKNDNINDIVLKNNKSNNLSSKKKKISISSNGIKFKKEENQNIQENNSNSSRLKNLENSKIESNIENNPKSNFTNFMQDLDISFSNNNKVEQNDIFNINYINIKNEYNQEIIDYLNKIRTEPNSIILDINDLLKKAKINGNNKLEIESEETHENIILEDGGEALEETKNYLNKVIPSNFQFSLNEELIIDISESEKKNDLPFDKKIAKILLDKRKNIINTYPNCQFFINFIKDQKMGLLFLLSQNEEMSNFRTILFDNKYTQFNVTWMMEQKKIFVAFLCFA